VAQASPAEPVGNILLINGDWVIQPRTGSGTAVTLVRAGRTGVAGATVGLSLGGRRYLIPEPALAYLGRGLDWSLFDVPALAAREKVGRLPVVVSYRARLHPLPGVMITRSGGGTATGYLTAPSARVFGRALVRQFRADHAAAGYGLDGMFAGESVTLAGAAPGPVPRPAFPMHTLTVTAANLAGKPDTGGTVFVINVDNSGRFGSVSEFRHGVAKFSVPAGHYFAAGFFLSASGAVRLVAVPQFTVPANRPGTSVAVSERAADSRVTFTTPRPSVAEDVQFNLLRMPAAGKGLGIDVDNGTAPVWVSPARPARALAGSLHAAAHGLLGAPPPATARYQYYLAYQSDAAIPRQHYLVRASSLATVDERFVQAGHASANYGRFGYFAWEGGYGSTLPLLSVPARRTEYVTGSPGVRWADIFLPSYSYESASPRVFTGGEHAREYWNAVPLHAGVNTLLGGVANLLPTWPSATRAGNTLTLDITPFTDNQPGHAGPGFRADPSAAGPVTGSYEIGQNGTEIAAGRAHTGALVNPDLFTRVALRPEPSKITFTLNASRRGKAYGMATSSHTVWTWRSSSQAGRVLPAGWACPGAARCVVQPLLTLEYAVAGLGLNESAPPGKQVLHVFARHLQLAPAAKITGATVAVSVDGGKTWHPAAVVGHGARYRVVFTAPAGVTVALRTRVHDAAGGRFSETITGAYQTAPPGAPDRPQRGRRH
jgi:hypothetical protein